MQSKNVDDKMRKTKRALVLKPIDGKVTKNTIGLLDPRIFTGEQNVYAVKDDQTNLWYIRYDRGIMPEPLQERFTSFEKCLRHAQQYFKKRNVQVDKVID